MSKARDPDEDVELGMRVRVRRKRLGAIVAVRMDRDMVVALDEYATEHGLLLSEAVREAVFRLLHPQATMTITKSTAQTLNLTAESVSP